MTARKPGEPEPKKKHGEPAQRTTDDKPRILTVEMGSGRKKTHLVPGPGADEVVRVSLAVDERSCAAVKELHTRHVDAEQHRLR